jgi:hypothetical protein
LHRDSAGSGKIDSSLVENVVKGRQNSYSILLPGGNPGSKAGAPVLKIIHLYDNLSKIATTGS